MESVFAQSTETKPPEAYDVIYLKDGTQQRVTLKRKNEHGTGRVIHFETIQGNYDSISADKASRYEDYLGETYKSKAFPLGDTVFQVFTEFSTAKNLWFYTYYDAGEQYVLIEFPSTQRQIVLTKSNYRSQLVSEFMVPEEKAMFLDNIKFTSTSLAVAIKRLEKKDYSPLPFSFISVEGGFTSNSFYWTQPQLGNQTFDNTNSFTVGFQVVLPLGYSSTAFTAGIFYNRMNYLSELEPDESSQFSFKVHQFRIPFVLRYTFSEHPIIKPYIAGGVTWNINEGEGFNVLLSDPSDSLYSVGLVGNETVIKNPVHLTLAFGLSFRLKNKKLLYFESRYAYQTSEAVLKNDYLQVVFGISL